MPPPKNVTYILDKHNEDTGDQKPLSIAPGKKVRFEHAYGQIPVVRAKAFPPRYEQIDFSVTADDNAVEITNIRDVELVAGFFLRWVKAKPHPTIEFADLRDGRLNIVDVEVDVEEEV